jgi:hypothetical protein
MPAGAAGARRPIRGVPASSPNVQSLQLGRKVAVAARYGVGVVHAAGPLTRRSPAGSAFTANRRGCRDPERGVSEAG